VVILEGARGTGCAALSDAIEEFVCVDKASRRRLEFEIFVSCGKSSFVQVEVSFLFSP
jgi:hypothetical protein